MCAKSLDGLGKQLLGLTQQSAGLVKVGQHLNAVGQQLVLLLVGGPLPGDTQVGEFGA